MFKEDEKIDKYQLSLMKEKEKYNFNECLLDKSDDKKQFDKVFRTDLDILINTFLSKGVLFYGFTINFSELRNVTDEDRRGCWQMIHFRVEEFLTISKKHVELLEFVYLSIECHGKLIKHNNLSSFLSLPTPTSTLKSSFLTNENENEDKDNNNNNIDISKEEQKTLKGLPHIHGIIGIRSLIGKNDMLLTQLNKNYSMLYSDMLIKSLKSFKQIKGYWNYVIKEQNYKFHRFAFFSNIYDNDYGKIADDELILDYQKQSLGLGLIDNAVHKNIIGIGTSKYNNKRVLIYLISLYMHIKDMTIYQNDFYIKIKESKFSWKLMSDISYLKNNCITMLLELQKMFPQQLEHLDINQLILDHLEIVYNDVLKNNKYLPNIELNKSIIEFSDGLYFLDYNYFFEYDNNREKLKKLKINCYKYFKRTYNYCLITKPLKWLECLLNNFESNEELDNFCAHLGRYFHSNQLVNKKKKTLCIKGGSNTGKTMLIAKIITEAIGLQNIGIISNESDTFAFEQVEDKQVIICDEFKYSTSNRSDLLKILDNEPILLNKKGVTKKLYVNEAPILFIFNESTNNKMLEDQAFINRLLIYTFTYQITTMTEQIKKALIDELPQIIVYCNKLYFEKNQVKDSHKKNSKKISQKITKLLIKE